MMILPHTVLPHTLQPHCTTPHSTTTLYYPTLQSHCTTTLYNHTLQSHLYFIFSFLFFSILFHNFCFSYILFFLFFFSQFCFSCILFLFAFVSEIFFFAFTINVLSIYFSYPFLIKFTCKSLLCFILIIYFFNLTNYFLFHFFGRIEGNKKNAFFN